MNDQVWVTVFLVETACWEVQSSKAILHTLCRCCCTRGFIIPLIPSITARAFPHHGQLHFTHPSPVIRLLCWNLFNIWDCYLGPPIHFYTCKTYDIYRDKEPPNNPSSKKKKPTEFLGLFTWSVEIVAVKGYDRTDILFRQDGYDMASSALPLLCAIMSYLAEGISTRIFKWNEHM